MGHNHRRQAAGKQPALIPNVLTTSFAALTEIVTSLWVDLMPCAASRKMEGLLEMGRAGLLLGLPRSWESRRKVSRGNDYKAGLAAEPSPKSKLQQH